MSWERYKNTGEPSGFESRIVKIEKPPPEIIIIHYIDGSIRIGFFTEITTGDRSSVDMLGPPIILKEAANDTTQGRNEALRLKRQGFRTGEITRVLAEKHGKTERTIKRWIRYWKDLELWDDT